MTPKPFGTDFYDEAWKEAWSRRLENMAVREVHVAVEPSRQALKSELIPVERRWGAERREGSPHVRRVLIGGSQTFYGVMPDRGVRERTFSVTGFVPDPDPLD